MKDLLSYTKMPKATYMYRHKRLGRVNPDRDLENKIKKIRVKHKNYGYRRITGELRNQGLLVNKKKVQRIVQKLNLQVTSFTRKSRKYNSYKGKVGTVAPNRIHRRFTTCIPHQKITTDTTEFKYYEVEAIKVTSDCPYRRTFHSNQGWGYQMKRYIHNLKQNRIFQSMSRKGNCHDNSVNEERIKEKLGWLSPVQYRIRYTAV